MSLTAGTAAMTGIGFANSGLKQSVLNDGKIDYGQALKEGVTTGLLFGVFTGAAQLLSGGNALSRATASEEVISSTKGPSETYYRTMSESDYQTFSQTGKIPATGETFISPSEAYSQRYNGVTVEFQVNEGTTSQLAGIGVRNTSKAVANMYGDMPLVSTSKGWTTTNAYFKGEGGLINIGLGKGAGLDIFNNNIIDSSIVGGN